MVTAIVVAAGSSQRFGGDRSKLLVSWQGRPLLVRTLETLDACPEVDEVVLVTSEAVAEAWEDLGRPGAKVRTRVAGGDSRQASMGRGLAECSEETDIVLVHDGARPFASVELIGRVVAAAREHGAALPVLPVVDTVKRVDGQAVVTTVPRDELGLAQTPQAVRRDWLEQALAHAEQAFPEPLTDDVALVEAARDAGVLPSSLRIHAVAGDETNRKITRPTDLPRSSSLRVGLGHDVHQLVSGRRFVLAGVDLLPDLPDDESFGPHGHSDGDVLTHAVCDALLSAAGLGDIGQHFSDEDPENEGRSSLEFLRGVVELLASRSFGVVSISAVVKLERPKVAPHSAAIKQALAEVMGLAPDRLGLSAKRGEQVGPVGRGEAVESQVVALVEQFE
ncbi:MAG: 2-C-methyl-D-erythritol 2,4-cyclodiphosphate synthase [Acidobacteriota bacterium]